MYEAHNNTQMSVCVLNTTKQHTAVLQTFQAFRTGIHLVIVPFNGKTQ